jgi:hypothetical protein
MAFTEGQMYFAFSFLVVFIIAMIFAYRSDIKQIGKHANGAKTVLALIVFVMLIFYGTVKFLAS